LALLTSLEVAAHWGTKEKPVTFVGIGNPKGATVAFRDAVEVLEREGKMRVLGVHNYLDIVPMLPNTAIQVQTKNCFCQVGFQMQLHTDHFVMHYCPKSDKPWQEFRQTAGNISRAVIGPHKISGRHHYLTYLSRLRALEGPLSRLYLNDYYNHIVQEDLFVGSEGRNVPIKVARHHFQDHDD
jgi:hypothetical protein